MPLRPALSVAVLALAASLLLAACVAVQPDLASPPTLYTDEYVHRNFFPEVVVRPAQPKAARPQTAVFFPFTTRQRIKDADLMAEQLSRSFWGRWVGMMVFDTLPFVAGEPMKNPAAALARARAAGADLAVSGEVTHMLFGGTAGDSAIALRVDIYDVATGELLWSMGHGGSMSAGLTRDYFFFASKNRLPSDPAAAIVQALAEDLGKPVREWNFGDLLKKKNKPEPSVMDDPAPAKKKP
jgi:hypothetical protein